MSIRHLSIALLAFTIVTGSGCRIEVLPPEQPSVTSPAPVVTTWETVDDGVARREYALSTSTNTALILYRLDPSKYAFRWDQDTAPHTMNDWLAREPRAKLMVNGVYFQEDFSPAGALITKGKLVKKREFDLDKTAYLILAPEPRIVDTKTKALDKTGLQEAGQSYPLLVSDQKPGIAREGKQMARRTLVGFDTQGQMYIGIIPYGEVSLVELMRSLLRMDINWIDVLNLDGGPSSGLSANFRDKQERISSYVGVPNILVVEPR